MTQIKLEIGGKLPILQAGEGRKDCSKCGVEKELSGFCRSSKSKDGHAAQCRICRRVNYRKYIAVNREECNTRKRELYAANPERFASYTNKWRERNPGCSKKWNKRYRDANPELVKSRHADWRRNNTEKHAAHRMVEWATRIGLLVRQPCEVCGAGGVHAHHDSYDPFRHLDVRWLCPKHHSRHHAQEAS